MSKVVEELNFIKTVIVEQHASVQRLQFAEKRAELEKATIPEINPLATAPPFYTSQALPAAGPPTLPSPESEISGSDGIEDTPESENGVKAPSKLTDAVEPNSMEDDAKALTLRPRAVTSYSPKLSSAGPRASSLLLQMIPYKSNAIAFSQYRNLLTFVRPREG